MFNGNRNRAASAPHAAASAKRGMFSVFGPDVTVTGSIVATADLHIEGRVEGDVACGNLVQGAESRVQGNVTAETARIAGAIEGSVRVQQLIVEHSARIIGDIEYQTITIEQGGHVEGRMKHIPVIDSSAGPRTLPAPAREEEAA